MDSVQLTRGRGGVRRRRLAGSTITPRPSGAGGAGMSYLRSTPFASDMRARMSYRDSVRFSVPTVRRQQQARRALSGLSRGEASAALTAEQAARSATQGFPAAVAAGAVVTTFSRPNEAAP